MLDCVRHQSANVAHFETVGVTPEAVRAPQREVDEQGGRAPFLNAGGPVQLHAMPGELVMDQSASSEFAVSLAQGLEVKPGRGDSVQVARLAEKGKVLRQRCCDPLFAMEGANSCNCNCGAIGFWSDFIWFLQSLVSRSC